MINNRANNSPADKWQKKLMSMMIISILAVLVLSTIDQAVTRIILLAQPPTDSQFTVSLSSILDPVKAQLAVDQAALFFSRPFEEQKLEWDNLGPVFDPCFGTETFGGKGDEEKRFCRQPTPLGGNCTVYSLGSNNQWEFEVDMAKRTKCLIYTFDCTVRKGFNVPPELKDRGNQFPVCVGTGPGFPRYLTVEQLMEMTKTEGKVDYFKMDVEGAEWPVIRNIVDTAVTEGNDHILPDQMAFEVHSFNPSRAKKDLYCLMANLFYEAGYVLAGRKRNPRCKGCQEILIVRAGRGLGIQHPECTGLLY